MSEVLIITGLAEQKDRQIRSPNSIGRSEPIGHWSPHRFIDLVYKRHSDFRSRRCNSAPGAHWAQKRWASQTNFMT
jgi:hypothetical protein